MRVLVTRPLPSAERTAKSLRDMGHEPVLLPLSQPVHDSKAALEGLARSNGPIAITSAEAVRVLSSAGEDIKPYLLRPLFAVGGASAKEAKAIGFNSVTASSGDGAQLAELIAHQTRETVIYLAGSPRAETFELRARALDLQARRRRMLSNAACNTRSRHAANSTERRRRGPFFFTPVRLRRAFSISLKFNRNRPGSAMPSSFVSANQSPQPFRLRSTKKLRIAASPDEQSLLSLL